MPHSGHSNHALAPEKDVRVVNSAKEPVPVAVQNEPQVKVANSPTVKAQQNGAWNVSINGTPSVQVGNAATDPVFVRDVDRPTAQPYQKAVDIALAPGEGAKYGAIPVPARQNFRY